MEIARLILAYVSALVWPIALLTAVIVLRIPLSSLVQRLSSAEFLGVKTIFSNEVAELQRSVESAETMRELDTHRVMADANVQTNGDRGSSSRQDTTALPHPPTFAKKSPSAVNAALNLYVQYVLSQVFTEVAQRERIQLTAEIDSLTQACNRLAAITRIPAWGEASNVIVRWDELWRSYGRRLVAGQLVRVWLQTSAHEAAESIRSVASFTLNRRGGRVLPPEDKTESQVGS